MPKGARVHLYPTGTAYLQGVAAVERIVPADMADVLVDSGAFTRSRPADQKEPSADAIEDTTDIENALVKFTTAPVIGPGPNEPETAGEKVNPDA